MKVLVAALVWLAALGPAAGAEDPAAALSLLRPRPTQPARDFLLSTPDDRPIRLSELKGKIVLLNFWATWCKPCEEEMPGMERLHRRYRDRGLVVLGVSVDAGGAAAVAPFLTRHGITFPVVLDPKMHVAGLYGVWTMPTTFVVDRQGQRAYFASGSRNWGGPASYAFFESLLEGGAEASRAR